MGDNLHVFWAEVCTALNIRTPPPALELEAPPLQCVDVGPLAIDSKKRRCGDDYAQHVDPKALLNDSWSSLEECNDDWRDDRDRTLKKRRRTREVGITCNNNSTFIPIPPGEQILTFNGMPF